MEIFSVRNNVLSAQSNYPIEVDISERKEKILRAVITWFTRNDKPADRVGLMTWFFNGNIQKSTEYQLKMKRQLQEFLPALFEDHDDDSTFANTNNRTPLHCCISKMEDSRYEEPADGQVVSALCDLGMSKLALDCDGHSPLGIALHKGRMDLVQILIRSGCKNFADHNNRGQTALHILIDKYNYHSGDYKKYQVLVMELLRKGADINQPDRDGVTPVHLAAKKLDTELLKKFRKNGANLNRRTNCGDDLLIIACKSLTTSQGYKSKALECINWLVVFQGFRANVKNNNGITALHYAARSENIDLVKSVLGARADIHAVSHDDTNVLHWAAVSPDFGVMQHLIMQNVDCRRRDNVYGFSLIHMATFSGDPTKCEWLVKEHRFDVDDLGKFHLTPLHLASMRGHVKVVGKLIELGADVHRTDDKFHRTALHFASLRGRVATLRDIRLNGHEEIKEDRSSLVDHCLNNHSLLDRKIDYVATIIALLKAGVDVNARDSHGCTALHYATRESTRHVNNDRIILALLEAGAHVDVLDNKCSTPLENSFFSNNIYGLRNLLGLGANINDIAHLNDQIFETATIFDSAASVIVEHLFKLKIAGLHIDQAYRRSLDNVGPDYLKKVDDFLSELTTMKRVMLTVEVSLYDVLHMNYKNRSTFANSLPRDIETKFPNYSVVLNGKCNEAVNRMALFEPAREAFQWMTGMPDICIDIIMSLMSNVSLRVLIDAASLTE